MISFDIYYGYLNMFCHMQTRHKTCTGTHWFIDRWSRFVESWLFSWSYRSSIFLLFFTICICLYIICRYTYSRLYDSARYGSLFQLSISVIIISLIYFNFRLKFIAIIYFAALLYSSKLLDADYIIRKCVLFDTFLPITLLRFSPDCDKFYKITYLNTQVDYGIN